MYADPSAAQAVLKQLNRWYRKKAEPHGTIDHYYRGTRMSYTAAYRTVMFLFSVVMLSVDSVLYFVPDVFADKSPWVILALKIGWVGIILLAVLALLRAFRESTVVNDDGLIKINFLGGEARLKWTEISSFRIKPDDNSVSLIKNANTKLTMSLSYDGWQDFREMAARHLNPALYQQLDYALAKLDTKRADLPTIKKLRPPKWFSFGRGN